MSEGAGTVRLMLMTVWEAVEDVPSRSLQPGIRVQRYDRLPRGPRHAAAVDAEQALCGAPVAYVGPEWPGGLGPRCRECLELSLKPRT